MSDGNLQKICVNHSLQSETFLLQNVISSTVLHSALYAEFK